VVSQTLAAAHPHGVAGRGEEPGYARRRPEQTVLYQAVRAELESFLTQARERDRPVPRFVERELRAYLGCGILARGFVRVHCDACGCDRLVAFSCKGRGFCPSCGGRRMAETAAHLVDRVLPEVPVRQWVLSLPFALRYRLAYDARLASAVLALFVRSVFASLRRRARRTWGVQRPQCGAVTFVQRFGGALNLNVHFHSLLLDGVYALDADGSPRFHPLPPPTDAEVERVTRQVAKKLVRLLERRGLHPDADPADADPLPTDQPLLAALYAASVAGRVATGPRAGKPVQRLGDRIDVEDLPVSKGECCANVGGVSLHANVAVPARDRRRLERLCRYVARPPVATDRLSRLTDGRIVYRLKHRWRDGTTHVVFEPLELLEKLAALVPPPRFHLVRYHGILAPCAGARDHVVPAGRVSRTWPCPGVRTPTTPTREIAAPARGESVHLAHATAPSRTVRGADTAGVDSNPGVAPETDAPDLDEMPRHTPRRLSWAELMRRVFAIDVLECPNCGGPMRILAAIHPPETTRAMLECLELPSRAPPTGPARSEEAEDFVDAAPHADVGW
jgi:hypothetical protein